MKTYKVVPLREPTWWERGTVRYCCLSYSLWARQIRRDFKPPAAKK